MCLILNTIFPDFSPVQYLEANPFKSVEKQLVRVKQSKPISRNLYIYVYV